MAEEPVKETTDEEKKPFAEVRISFPNTQGTRYKAYCSESHFQRFCEIDDPCELIKVGHELSERACTDCEYFDDLHYWGEENARILKEERDKEHENNGCPCPDDGHSETAEQGQTH